MIKRFKILSILLLFVLAITSFFASGCFFLKELTQEEVEAYFETDGTFKYCMINSKLSAKYADDTYYVLSGHNKTYLSETAFVPAYFNGKPVLNLSLRYDDYEYNGVCWNGPKKIWAPTFNNVENLYLPYTIDLTKNKGTELFLKCNTVYITSTKTDANFVSDNIIDCENEKLYFTEKAYSRILSKYKRDYDEVKILNDYQFNWLGGVGLHWISRNPELIYQIANTTYRFNYEGSPNDDVFFINDFERGGKIENTPYEPLREGYKFAGWYKEPECINAWDFEKDALPVPEYYQDGKLKFVETKLYAKWEKGNATINPSKPVIKEELGTKVEYIVQNNTIVGANNYVKEKVTELEIPSEVNGIKITAIGDLAFAGLVSLRKVTISDGVEKIGNKAFAWCDNLSKVQIPETVIETGEGAFKYCISLKNVNLPKQIKEIKKDTFSHCEYLADIQLPDKLEKIEKNAFRWCLKLKQISIPDSVTDIGDYAFFNCCNLESVDFGANIIEIGNFAFRSCRIERLTLPNNLEEIGDYAFSCGVRDNSFLLLPETLKEIGSFAFDAGHWTEVVIPKQVSIIRKCAFFRCNDLKVKCEAIEKGALWDEDWRLYKISPYDTNDRSYFEVEWGC